MNSCCLTREIYLLLFGHKSGVDTPSASGEQMVRPSAYVGQLSGWSSSFTIDGAVKNSKWFIHLLAPFVRRHGVANLLHPEYLQAQC